MWLQYVIELQVSSVIDFLQVIVGLSSSKVFRIPNQLYVAYLTVHFSLYFTNVCSFSIDFANFKFGDIIELVGSPYKDLQISQRFEKYIEGESSPL